LRIIARLRANWIPLALFGGSLGYYYALSSKIFTWIYTSGDAGDWLVQTNWWMVPQCFGKPLYISLIHLTNYVPIASDAFRITFLLSVIPGAIMVSLTYLIAKHMTQSTKLGITAALVVLGANIVLSQATVLEQYTIVGALFLASFYFYITGHKKLTMAFLGLTTATHIVGAIFAVLFGLIEWKNRKEWLKAIPMFVICGILPYALILWLMADPESPKLLAGNLSWGTINSWGGNTTSTAALALIEAPNRFREGFLVAITSLGLAWIPVWKGFAKPWDNKMKFLIAVFGFTAWFYVTNLFPSVWKFLTPTIPLVACVAVLGLKKLPGWHYKAITIGAVVLIAVNGFMFNTNKIAHEDQQATEYLQALEELPDGSCLITPRGGAYGFSIFYKMSEGKELIPLALSSPELWHEEQDGSYVDYTEWLNRKYNIKGRNIYELTNDALAKGHPVYFATPMTKIWNTAFIYEESGQDYLHKVTGVRYAPEWPDVTMLISPAGRAWQMYQTVTGEDKK